MMLFLFKSKNYEDHFQAEEGAGQKNSSFFTCLASKATPMNRGKKNSFGI